MKENVTVELYSTQYRKNDIQMYVRKSECISEVLCIVELRLQHSFVNGISNTSIRYASSDLCSVGSASLEDFNSKVLYTLLEDYIVDRIKCYSRTESFVLSDFAKTNGIPVHRYYDELMKRNDINATSLLDAEVILKLMNIGSNANYVSSRHELYNSQHLYLDALSVAGLNRYFKFEETMITLGKEQTLKSLINMPASDELTNNLHKVQKSLLAEITSLTVGLLIDVMEGKVNLDKTQSASPYVKVILDKLQNKIQDKSELLEKLHSWLDTNTTLFDVVTSILGTAYSDIKEDWFIPVVTTRRDRNGTKIISPALLVKEDVRRDLEKLRIGSII